MGKRQDPTPEECATISGLLTRYMDARKYSGAALARETKLAPGSKSLFSRVRNGNCDGLSAYVALKVSRVLHFGVVLPGDPPELQPDDHDIWMEVTHAAELVELAIDDEIETGVIDLLEYLHGWRGTPIYFPTWGRARWSELCLNFVQAEPLLEEVLYAALKSKGPEELLGIMRQDLTEAYLAKGNLTKARQECALSEDGFEKLYRNNGGITAKLGVGRAKAQRLQIAAWEGSDAAVCRECAEEALAVMHSIKDHYGVSKVRHVLAYVALVDGDLDLAAQEVKEAKIEAKKIRTPRKLLYWALRDGLLFGAQWMNIHASALQADVDAAIAHVVGESLSAKQLLMPALPRVTRRWSHQIPPLYPFYSWRYKLSTQSPFVLKLRLQRQIRRMLDGGLIMYAPHAMVSLGDFLAEVEGDLDGARSWYQQAHNLAGEHAMLRAQRMAAARLQGA